MSSRLHQYLFENDVLFKLSGEVLPAFSGEVDSSDSSASVPTKHESIPDTQVPVAKPDSPFYRLKSRLLILVETYGKGIAPEERQFLTKVLKAVHYDIEQVDVLEFDTLDSKDASVVLHDGLADYVLLIGVKPEMASLPFQLSLFEPVQHNEIWFLLSNSLRRIEMEETLKRSLWEALKKMFFK